MAHLYRLAVEQTGSGVTTYQVMQEEGVPLREVAEALAKGLNVPLKSIALEEASGHFALIGHFTGLDMSWLDATEARLESRGSLPDRRSEGRGLQPAVISSGEATATRADRQTAKGALLLIITWQQSRH